MSANRSAEVPSASAFDAVPVASNRFHALDSARATAMLLGVFYHSILFAGFAGGGPPGGGPGGPGGGGGPDPSRLVGDWLHSFRMPLFFLISGFFCRMMLDKYGMRNYFRRRWARIGVPLLVGMFTFCPLYILTRDLTSRGGGPGPGSMRAPGPGGPPPGMPPGMQAMTRPPQGIVPTPLEPFDKNHDGELSDQEWEEATRELGGPPGRGPRPGPGGFRPGGPPGPFGGGENALAGKVFGSSARYFELHHLWFLWYLLVFATVGPWVANGFSLVFSRGSADARIRTLTRWGLAPFALALLGTPALLMTSSPFGWYLGLAPAIFRGFPDFLLHFDWDMAFYFVYFLAGWLLHREREVLLSLAQTWLLDLLLGLVAFAVATVLSTKYARTPDAPNYGLIRVGAYAIYCLGSSLTAFAFLGVFLRYLDWPSRTWRYLADTALWVYLIHQPLVLIGLALVRPLKLNWWMQPVLVTALSAGAALLLYEALVRHTPLVWLFGPTIARKKKQEPAGVAVEV